MASLVFDQEEAEEKLLAQALFVDPDDNDVDDEDQGLPATAEAYLKKVVREARKLESTKTAENAEELLSKAPSKPTHVDREKTETDQDLLPTKEWQIEQVKNFTDVRTKVARHFALIKSSPKSQDNLPKLPSFKNEQGWCTFCFGNEFWVKLKAKEEEEEERSVEKSFAQVTSGEGHPPLLHILASFKQSVITRLLEWHAEWAETLEEVDSNQALWFYALMSAVEKPLHPDVESALRSFVLICSQTRKESSECNHLNLIICLVARYFGQADLADDY